MAEVKEVVDTSMPSAPSADASVSKASAPSADASALGAKNSASTAGASKEYVDTRIAALEAKLKRSVRVSLIIAFVAFIFIVISSYVVLAEVNALAGISKDIKRLDAKIAKAIAP